MLGGISGKKKKLVELWHRLQRYRNLHRTQLYPCYDTRYVQWRDVQMCKRFCTSLRSPSPIPPGYTRTFRPATSQAPAPLHQLSWPVCDLRSGSGRLIKCAWFLYRNTSCSVAE